MNTSLLEGACADPFSDSCYCPWHVAATEQYGRGTQRPLAPCDATEDAWLGRRWESRVFDSLVHSAMGQRPCRAAFPTWDPATVPPEPVALALMTSAEGSDVWPLVGAEGCPTATGDGLDDAACSISVVGGERLRTIYAAARARCHIRPEVPVAARQWPRQVNLAEAWPVRCLLGTEAGPWCQAGPHECGGACADRQVIYEWTLACQVHAPLHAREALEMAAAATNIDSDEDGWVIKGPFRAVGFRAGFVVWQAMVRALGPVGSLPQPPAGSGPASVEAMLLLRRAKTGMGALAGYMADVSSVAHTLALYSRAESDETLGRALSIFLGANDVVGLPHDAATGDVNSWLLRWPSAAAVQRSIEGLADMMEAVQARRELLGGAIVDACIHEVFVACFSPRYAIHAVSAPGGAQAPCPPWFGRPARRITEALAALRCAGSGAARPSAPEEEAVDAMLEASGDWPRFCSAYSAWSLLPPAASKLAAAREAVGRIFDGERAMMGIWCGRVEGVLSPVDNEQ